LPIAAGRDNLRPSFVPRRSNGRRPHGPWTRHCHRRRGIGAAISKKLAADGYSIAVNFASDERAAEATVAAIWSAGGKAQAFRADVGEPVAIPRLF
jgi:hypothetical protein